MGEGKGEGEREREGEGEGEGEGESYMYHHKLIKSFKIQEQLTWLVCGIFAPKPKAGNSLSLTMNQSKTSVKNKEA